jgi:hypothetical protein
MVSKEEWVQHVTDYRQSGLNNVRGYCRDNNLSYQAFRYWISRLSEPKSDDFKQSARQKHKGNLLPVVIQAQNSSAKLQLSVNEVNLHLDSNFNEQLLKRVLSLLKEC